MVINGKYYGSMTKEKAKTIIDEYKGASLNV
jgi:NADH:ubiquinone oxidoreductase subunit E